MGEEQRRIFTVYELAQGLKQTVEAATFGCYVEGELGRIQRPVSGHLYFSLKDDRRDAMIDCVMYKRDAMRFGARLVEGQRVVLRGRATFYPPRGRLQWVADAAKPAGQGALLEALERLKKKLIAEGLTDPGRKRALPPAPRTVGVVTSRTGAALSDIRTVAERRGRVKIVIAPAVVQGEGAAESLLTALDRIERFNPDVVIVGRGGGSAEDLMAFNDERVVRRVARMAVPVVSAVGHEIDLALTDMVADARAATPSQAAELVVPDAQAQLQLIARYRAHLGRTMLATIVERRLELNQRRSKIGDPRFLLFDHQQALDERRMELRELMEQQLLERRRILEKRRRGLLDRHPRVVISQSRARLEPTQQRLSALMRSVLMAYRSQLSQKGASLNALSPLSVLGRGYALASTPAQRVIRDASTLKVGESVTVVLQKGSFSANVEKLHPGVENTLAFDQESERAGDTH